ncbi:2-hydroxyacid dehydrogenase [Portibacter lacus]|uniref:Phosphoglycerate dehydrogenase n=1 Tax=Portibacter lacus TaxID=1099794 RepID=A0AA37SVR3_9BACT|nr:hydroxyacid dehydrogenase [Portibacter lacus]GLR20185.1 hypothetical protein GCM10007940_48010 [Portibacter lacus]
MTKHTVLMLETIADNAMEMLEQADDVSIIWESDLAGNESVVDGIITRGKGQVNEQLLTSLPNLKAVARCGVGLDNVDIPTATKHQIQVLNTPGENSATIAEHTISLLLMLVRHLYSSINDTKSGNWESRKNFGGDEIRGKTLGLLGMGNIGSQVAKMAELFGMKVIYANLDKVDVPYEYVTIDELIQQSDVISIHLPLTKSTSKMVDDSFLSKMKEGSYLINTARGGIIDEEALVEALNSGHIAGFAADVLAVEPPADNHPLVIHPSTLITAHVGSLTKLTFENMCVLSVENILSLLRGDYVDRKYRFNEV